MMVDVLQEEMARLARVLQVYCTNVTVMHKGSV